MVFAADPDLFILGCSTAGLREMDSDSVSILRERRSTYLWT